MEGSKKVKSLVLVCLISVLLHPFWLISANVEGEHVLLFFFSTGNSFLLFAFNYFWTLILDFCNLAEWGFEFENVCAVYLFS